MELITVEESIRQKHPSNEYDEDNAIQSNNL